MSGVVRSGAAGDEEDTERAALRDALAAEHAAVYAYGVVGGVLGSDSAQAAAGYTTHRGRRDQLIAMLGADAVPAKPTYQLPFGVSRPPQARRLAALVESRCAEVYAAVVARTAGESRLYATRALTDCAVRGLGWGAEAEPFPGLRGR